MSRLMSDEEKAVAAVMAREDLYFFARWMFKARKGSTWRRAHHHKLICDALMRVYRGECSRLIINIPPRYSKTELAVINFIAWAMGKNPDSEFIHASYSAILATNNSASVRSVVQSEAFARIFPGVMLSSDARHHWKTTAGGVMYATGAGGTITGFGAGKHRTGFGGAIVIDDPHKADEARSEIRRTGVIDWFQNTLESRKNSPDTPIIVIMQRLHESDLAGWLINGGNGEEWDVLSLSAWQDDGTPLWPEKHDAEALRRMEQAAPYVFAGQYMQRPAPLDGGIFKPGNIQIIDAMPACKKLVRGWDLGATVGGDPTAGVKLGMLDDGRYVIADVVVGDASPDERDALIRSTAELDGRGVFIGLPQDPGQAGKSLALYMTRQLGGFNVKSSPESGDKITRALPVASQCNVGNVLMVRGSWNARLIDEMRMFPNGRHDDQVDALSRAFSDIIGAEMVSAERWLSLGR